MDALSKPRTWVILGATALGLVLLWQLWVWEVERIEVPPNHFLVKINLWGKDLREGEIVAPDDSYKGIQRKVLTEGRHFLNPIFHTYEKHKVLEVPDGQCAVLTRKAGTEVLPDDKARGVYLAQGEFDEFAATAPGQRGILEQVLGPGKYYVNPYEYSYEMVKYVKVTTEQVGIKVLKWGKDPKELLPLLAQGKKELQAHEKKVKDLPARDREQFVKKWAAKASSEPEVAEWLVKHVLSTPTLEAAMAGLEEAEVRVKTDGIYVVPAGYRGVQMKALQPADYYVNPYVEGIVPVDTRSHPVDFTDIVFPSRDGFMIQPHVMVAYKVVPEMAPELFVLLCDYGELPQKDGTVEDQKKNPILQKVVLPLVRGYVRIEGSKYDARDYVSYTQKTDGKGASASFNPRERLQAGLMRAVAPACQKVGIVIEQITVAQPDMNTDLEKLASSIAEREQTRLVREKNKQLVEQYKQEQDLRAKEALAERSRMVVDAEKKLEQEKIVAARRKKVEQGKLASDLKAAETILEGAKKKAEGIVLTAKRASTVTMAKNEAEVAGLRTKVGGFTSPEQFAHYEVLLKLSPALSEIFASDTSEFAKLFSAYMNGAGKKPAAPPLAGGPTDAKKP